MWGPARFGTRFQASGSGSGYPWLLCTVTGIPGQAPPPADCVRSGAAPLASCIRSGVAPPPLAAWLPWKLYAPAGRANRWPRGCPWQVVYAPAAAQRPQWLSDNKPGTRAPPSSSCGLLVVQRNCQGFNFLDQRPQRLSNNKPRTPAPPNGAGVLRVVQQRGRGFNFRAADTHRYVRTMDRTGQGPAA